MSFRDNRNAVTHDDDVGVIDVHSANPVGATKMAQALQRWSYRLRKAEWSPHPQENEGIPSGMVTASLSPAAAQITLSRTSPTTCAAHQGHHQLEGRFGAFDDAQ